MLVNLILIAMFLVESYGVYLAIPLIVAYPELIVQGLLVIFVLNLFFWAIKVKPTMIVNSFLSKVSKTKSGKYFSVFILWSFGALSFITYNHYPIFGLGGRYRYAAFAMFCALWPIFIAYGIITSKKK
jgi:hypothetical protein